MNLLGFIRRKGDDCSWLWMTGCIRHDRLSDVPYPARMFQYGEGRMIRVEVECLYRRNHTQRSGLTMVELLTVVGVTGLLMSLLLPAVQQSRAASRRIQCQNNLHQIGLALHSFHDQHGFINTLQPLESILPQMDQSMLFEEFERARESAGTQVNDDALDRNSPTSYICPADSRADVRELHSNYAISGAPSVDGNAFRQPVGPDAKRRFKEVLDGLSNTAGFAERLVLVPEPGLLTADEGRQHPLRFAWRTLRYFPPSEMHELAAHCLSEAVRSAASPGGFRGDRLFNEPRYNHLLPPNNWPFTDNGPATDGAMGEGPVSPSSLHAGGAFVLLLDGSVDFISNAIDLEIFWGMGTIDGGEVGIR